jgi:hypothetical protein
VSPPCSQVINSSTAGHTLQADLKIEIDFRLRTEAWPPESFRPVYLAAAGRNMLAFGSCWTGVWQASSRRSWGRPGFCSGRSTRLFMSATERPPSSGVHQAEVIHPVVLLDRAYQSDLKE